MTMDCGLARRILWPESGPREVTAELDEARQHTEGCPACRAFLRDMAALRDGLRSLANDIKAPLHVRERVFGAVARARTASVPVKPVRRPWLRWASAGLAAGVFLASSVWLISEQRESADRFGALASDHARNFGQDDIVSADASVISAWLSERVSFAVRVPVFEDATLRGAELCLDQCDNGAVLHYLVAGETVSYYIIPAEMDLVPTPEDDEHRTSRSGFGVVAWQEPGLVHAMVGNVPESVLHDLARSCRQQFRGQAYHRAPARTSPIS